jgi:hypothetical protein
VPAVATGASGLIHDAVADEVDSHSGAGTYDDAGHAPHVTHPGDYLSLVIAFLAEAGASPAYSPSSAVSRSRSRRAHL